MAEKKRLKNVNIKCECGRPYMKAYTIYSPATGETKAVIKCDNCGRKHTVFQSKFTQEEPGA